VVSKAHHGQAPKYLCDLCKPVSDLSIKSLNSRDSLSGLYYFWSTCIALIDFSDLICILAPYAGVWSKLGMVLHIGGDLAPSLGGRKQISQTEISEWRFLGKNFHFHAQNISDDLFSSHWPCFSDFFYPFSDFSYLYCMSCCMWPFFTRKTPISENNSLMTPFFTLFVLLRASDKHYFSKYWMHGPSPTSNFGGTVPPFPPRSPPMVLHIHCKPIYMQ